MGAQAYIDAFHSLLKNFPNTFTNEDKITKAVIQFFQNINNFQALFSAILQDKLLNTWAFKPSISIIWDTLLEQGVPLYHSENEDVIPILRPQPGHTSLQLILSLYCYHLAQARWEEENEGINRELYEVAIEELELAETYGSFHALAVLNKRDILQINAACKENPRPWIALDEILTRAQKLAQLHGTPGYICLAITYLKFGEYHYPDSYIQKNCYKKALESLYIAEELKAFCAGALHNAYFGHALKEANPYGYSDLSEAINGFIATYAIDKYSDLTIKHCAKNAAQSFIRQKELAVQRTPSQLMMSY